MFDSLWPHESQHTRPPCPSPTPGVHPNSCALSRWCHLAISSSVVHFFSCAKSLPASGSFPMSQLFTWGGQSIGVSASASVLPMSTQDWFPLGWTGWISLLSKGLSSLLQHHSSKASILWHSSFMAAVTIYSDFGAQKNSLSLFPLFPHLFAMKWWDWMPWSLFFECWVLSQFFHTPLSLSSRGSLVPLHNYLAWFQHHSVSGNNEVQGEWSVSGPVKTHTKFIN